MSTLKHLIGGLVADLSTSISDKNLNKRAEITDLVVSHEDLDSATKSSAVAGLDALQDIVAATLDTVASSEDFNGADFLPSQYEAAKRIAALAINPSKAIEATKALRAVDGPAGAVTISAESYGIDNIVDGSKLSTEAFDGQSVNNALYWSIAYNFGAARQDEFCEAFFPTIVMDPTVSGFSIETELTNIINNYDRSIDGSSDRAKSKKIPLVKALYDNELLDSGKNKLAPVLRDENKALLLDNLPLQAESNGETVTSAPIKFGKTVSLLGVSQTDSLLAKGKFNNTDALDRTMNLERVYYSINGQDADGNAVTEYFYNDVSILPHSNFVYSQQDHHKDLALTFGSDDITIRVGSTLTAQSAASILLDGLNAAGYTIKLGVTLHGDSNTEFGDTTVYGSRVELAEVKDANGNVVPTTDSVYTAIAALFNTVKLEGYTVEAYRTNSNLRTRGTSFGYEAYTDIINVPLRSGITITTSTNNATGSDNDAGKLAAQIQAIGLQTSVDGVKRLTSFADTLNNVTQNGAVTDVTLMGIGRYHVDTYFNEKSINLPDYVDSVKSTERMADIKASLVNNIKDEVINMWVESNYGVAYTAANNGLGKKVTVIVGTDIKTKQYLTSGDGKVNIGDDFDVVVVATPNALVRGKIFIAFGIYDENRNVSANPFNFGNLAWAPTITTDIVRSDANGVVRELHNIPRYAHIINVPVLSVINVSGITTTLGKVAANRHTV